MTNERWMTTVLAASAALVSGRAMASGFADPPDEPRRRVTIVEDAGPAPERPSAGFGYRSDSAVRASVGSVARADGDALRAGVFAAVDFGRGPAGFRASAAWVRVGYDDPLAQYTGELTLSLGEYSRFVPTVGAGGGLARTYRVDGTRMRIDGGANLGVGVLRVAIDYRLPFADTDARAGISAMGVMPAVRASDAPDLPPWLLLAGTVSIGF